MKILFIQLPLIDHGYNYVDGNILYAPASLSSYIKKNFKNIFTEVLSVEISNFASDKIITKYILETSPDIVAFCTYLWNAERHLKIAEIIKEQNSSIKIIFGGPEVQAESFLFYKQRKQVDLFFSGEGEWFFKNYFNNINFNNHKKIFNENTIISQPQNELISDSEITEPFTSKMLNPLPDGSIFLELTRGCPYKCSYCFYSKNSYKIREIPFQNLVKAIEMSNFLSLNEIYILSPTFNKTKDFKENLKLLSKINKNIKLHTEMRASGIDKETANLIYKAGFRSLEVGLQSLNIKALEKIGRHGNIEEELIGIKNLKDANIEIKIGIIPGLPGDNVNTFKQTIDELVSKGFSDNIEFYPLMLLPGTKIRNEVKQENINFQKKPPYFIIESNGFTFDNILDLKEYIEQITGFYSLEKRLPDLTINRESKYFNSCMFDGNIISNWESKLYNEIIDSNVFNFHANIDKEIDLFIALQKLFSDKKETSELYNVVLITDIFFDENIIINFLNEFEVDNFYRRIHIYDSWSKGNRISFYQITKSIECFEKLYTNYQLIEPVLKITEKNIQKFKEYIETFEAPINILLSEKVYEINKDFFLDVYQSFLENISFTNDNDYKLFMKDCGHELIEYSINFSQKILNK